VSADLGPSLRSGRFRPAFTEPQRGPARRWRGIADMRCPVRLRKGMRHQSAHCSRASAAPSTLCPTAASSPRSKGGPETQPPAGTRSSSPPLPWMSTQHRSRGSTATTPGGCSPSPDTPYMPLSRPYVVVQPVTDIEGPGRSGSPPPPLPGRSTHPTASPHPSHPTYQSRRGRRSRWLQLAPVPRCCGCGWWRRRLIQRGREDAAHDVVGHHNPVVGV
jgi:hypothetical protein